MSNGLHDLVGVMNEEYDKIDRRAGREKQEIGYIVGLVQKTYDRLVNVVGSDNKRLLFDLTRKALKETEKSCFPPCVGVFYADPDTVKNAVLLNWINPIETKDSDSPYSSFSFYLTWLGRETVEDYKRFK